MEAIVERIVEKCIQSELIEESQRDWMAYSLQRKFMNFGGFFILVCFGTLVAPLPQVILLNFGLALLREKTNGLHMPTVFSCFITSLFCEYACLYLIDRLQSSTIAAAITLFIVSAMLILILAPCNNSAIQHFHPLPLQESYRAESANAPMLVMPENAAFCVEMFSGSCE